MVRYADCLPSYRTPIWLRVALVQRVVFASLATSGARLLQLSDRLFARRQIVG